MSSDIIGDAKGAVENIDEKLARFQEQIDEKLEKWLSQAEQRLTAAQGEAIAENERIARMTPDEREEHDLSLREAEIERRERELVKRELQAEAAEMLKSRGLPVALAEVLDFSGRDQCLKSVDIIDKAFRAAVKAAVDERLRQSHVDLIRNNSAADAESMSDEEYYRLKSAANNERMGF